MTGTVSVSDAASLRTRGAATAIRYRGPSAESWVASGQQSRDDSVLTGVERLSRRDAIAARYASGRRYAVERPPHDSAPAHVEGRNVLSVSLKIGQVRDDADKPVTAP